MVLNLAIFQIDINKDMLRKNKELEAAIPFRFFSWLNEDLAKQNFGSLACSYSWLDQMMQANEIFDPTRLWSGNPKHGQEHFLQSYPTRKSNFSPSR